MTISNGLVVLPSRMSINMKVKVHPHKTMVNSGIEACVSVTPDQKYGRAHYMGTVILQNMQFRIHQSGVKRAREEQVRNVHAWAVGDLLSEQSDQYPPSKDLLRNLQQVTYHFNIGRFLVLEGYRNGFACYGEDVTDKRFKAAYICGRDFFVSK